VEDFSKTYILDLGGDVRDNPKLSGTIHNVFGIMPGVCINLFIKRKTTVHAPGRIYYARLDEYWRKEQKFTFLAESASVSAVDWCQLEPAKDGTWFAEGLHSEYDQFLPLEPISSNGLFELHSLGVNTNRDAWAFNFRCEDLIENIQKTLDTYNSERLRFHLARRSNLTSLTSDSRLIKWSSSLRNFLERNIEGIFVEEDVRISAYRPFIHEYLYFNSLLTHRRAKLREIFPADRDNRLICVPGPGNRQGFGAFAAEVIPSLDFAFEKAQCFSFYTYDEDGTNRRENITDWALGEFRKHYGDKSISKWDIFHYTYGLLHHPEYRTRYAANLKRELPRIPMAPEFRRFAEIGAKLMKLHIDYEKQAEYPLERMETGKLDWRVEKMALSKDKTQLRYNEFLTLSGIPPEVYEYRLGNRSALDWVVDQYRVSTDARSGIVNDPNREDDPEYIVRLVGQVVTVSVETVRLVKELAGLSIDQE
jgi:predicted helicase